MDDFLLVQKAEEDTEENDEAKGEFYWNQL